MAYDFPIGPTVGQVYNSYVWDGEKWTLPKGVTPDRATIYAAPFDAMAYNGIQINGSMEVSQENGLLGLTVTSGQYKYIVDGWLVATNGVQVIQAVPQPTVGYVPLGYTQAIQMASSTANAAPAAADFCLFRHYIEGYRTIKLAWGTANASPITIGFWVYARRPGTYSVSVHNSAFDRNYVATFTVNAASTFEYKTATIPGCVDGTWNKDNRVGIVLDITMMAGSSYQGSPGAWGATAILGATGMTNGVAANTDLMILTGIVVLPGNEAPSAARSPLIMRPFDQELVTCKRYYRRLVPESMLAAANATTIFAVIRHEGLRSAPTVTVTGVVNVSDLFTASYVQSAAQVSIVAGDTEYSRLSFVNFTGVPTSRPLMWNTSEKINLDARF